MTESEQRHFEVLLEQVLHEVKTVAEGHEVLRNEIKVSHKELEDKIDLNSSLMKFGFETLDAKIENVREELKEDIQGVRTELKEDIQGVRTELKEDIQGVRTELKEDILGVQTELKEDIQGVRTELREMRVELKKEMAAGFKFVGVKVEGHEDRIRFLERKTA